MEPNHKLILFEVLTGLFFFLWLWAALLYARASRTAVIQRDIMVTIKRMYEDINLARVMLDANKHNLEAMKNLVEAVTTVGDRLSAYNEGLNHLTAAVRTKINRVDKEGIKM